jgi:hypothetical protein
MAARGGDAVLFFLGAADTSRRTRKLRHRAVGLEAPARLLHATPLVCIVNGHFYTRQDFPDWNKGKDGKEQTEEEKRAEHMQRMEGGKKHLRNWHGKLLPDYVEHFAKHRQTDLGKRSGQELLDFVEMLAEEAGEIWFIIAPIGYGFEEMGFKPHYEEKIPEEGRVHFSALFSGYPSRIFDAQQALYELATKVREQESLAGKLFAETAITDLPAWLQQRLAEYGHQLASLDFFWPTTGEDQAQLCQTLGVFAQQDIEAPEAQRQRTAQRRADRLLPDQRLGARRRQLLFSIGLAADARCSLGIGTEAGQSRRVNRHRRRIIPRKRRTARRGSRTGKHGGNFTATGRGGPTAHLAGTTPTRRTGHVGRKGRGGPWRKGLLRR